MARANVDDVAAALIRQGRSMTAMKLQKLTYYVQAWHLVHHGEPAFDDPIEAWAEGPVVRRLFQRHRGVRHVSSWTAGQPARLPQSVRAVVSDVLRRYGRRSAEELSTITHREQPWRTTRAGVPGGAPSSREIDLADMRAFYGRATADAESMVDDVIASARLEGGDTSAEEREILVSIATGHREAEDVIRKIISGAR